LRETLSDDRFDPPIPGEKQRAAKVTAQMAAAKWTAIAVQVEFEFGWRVG